MSIYIDVLPLERAILIVARGQIDAEEIAQAAKRLLEENVAGYAKIIDVTTSASDLTNEQVDAIAAMLREGRSDGARGPVAFVVDPARNGFAEVFADTTRNDRPIRLFRSLHEARKWARENSADPIYRGMRAR